MGVSGNIILGDTGESVKKLQKRLQAIGFYTGPIDGVYSVAVEDAVEMSQFANNLMADGEAGAVTLDALSILDKKESEPSGNARVAAKDKSLPSLNFSAMANLWHRSARGVAETHLREGFISIKDYTDDMHLHNDVELALFLGQVRQETGPRFKLEENLNYRCSALPKIFSAYRGKSGRKLAILHGRCDRHSANQMEIANTAYGNRRDLGNRGVKSGDGWLYKGAGLGHLTGLANYRKYQAWLKKYMPDLYKRYFGAQIMLQGFKLVSTSPHAFLSFVYFWHKNQLHKGADFGLSKQASHYVTAKVNLRTRSYDERWKFTKQASTFV